MFTGESPENFEQKCICVLVLDISGSMVGEPLNQLNKGLQEFSKEIEKNFVATQRLEVSIVTFGNIAQCIQEPALISNIAMPTLNASGSTKLVDGVRLGMSIVEKRKNWYRETGQNYFRPMIVLITDGEPDSDQDINGLSSEIASSIAAKKFMFYSLGVRGYNNQKLSLICSAPPPLPLDGYKFSEFFKWLSNSIGLMINSVEGQNLSLPPINDWTQIQM